MPSEVTYRAMWAVEDVREQGLAVLKFLAPNDVGLTGGHQCGPYLPKPAWRLFDDVGPEKGVNRTLNVAVTWPDGRKTESCIHYWGKTKNEYHLTRFGRNFPFLKQDDVGSLFVLVPKSKSEFSAHILADSDDIEHVIDSLGVDLPYDWGGVFEENPKEEEDADDCIAREIRRFTQLCGGFPTGRQVAEQVWKTIDACDPDFYHQTIDQQLLELHDLEFKLFTSIEKHIYTIEEHGRMQFSIDDFLKLAQSMLNRRKKRAGLALEFHVEHLLTRAGIALERQPKIDGNPDIVVPGANQYLDPEFPNEKLFVIAVKRTCRERWRQVLDEGKRIAKRHLITLQPGVSSKQLLQMEAGGIQLVVPEPLHKKFEKKCRHHLMTVDALVQELREAA